MHLGKLGKHGKHIARGAESDSVRRHATGAGIPEVLV